MDSTIFIPNLSPREVIEAGTFGGSYFGIAIDESEDDYTDLFESLFKGVDTRLYLGVKYSPKLNRFGVRSGMNYRYWKYMKWMRSQDPRGWFAWYCNYYLGRRSSDDERQIARWLAFAGPKGRFRLRLIGMCKAKKRPLTDETISPVIRQGLQHWGYVL